MFPFNICFKLLVLRFEVNSQAIESDPFQNLLYFLHMENWLLCGAWHGPLFDRPFKKQSHLAFRLELWSEFLLFHQFIPTGILPEFWSHDWNSYSLSISLHRQEFFKNSDHISSVELVWLIVCDDVVKFLNWDVISGVF